MQGKSIPTMDFLTTAVIAPLNNFGPIGMMIAVIIWVVSLYMGYSFAVSARKAGGLWFALFFTLAAIMVFGLVLMLTTRVFDDPNSVIMGAYAVLALITFGQIGGFIAVMSASCGFMFGVLVRMLDAMSRGMR